MEVKVKGVEQPIALAEVHGIGGSHKLSLLQLPPDSSYRKHLQKTGRIIGRISCAIVSTAVVGCSNAKNYSGHLDTLADSPKIIQRSKSVGIRAMDAHIPGDSNSA